MHYLRSRRKTLSNERLEYLLKIMEKNSIEYSVDNNSYEIRLIPEIQQAYNQIVALIKKGVTEEWIEEKARDLLNSLFAPSANTHCYLLPIIKDFIHKIVEEIHGRK